MIRIMKIKLFKIKVNRDCITTFDIYNDFKKECPESLKRKIKDKHLFSEIISFYFLCILVETFIYRSTHYLRHRLGSFSLRSHKINQDKLKVDYKESKLYGKKIHYLNEHSNYNYYVFHWSKRGLKYVSFYQFELNRVIKRALSLLIKNKIVK